MPRRIFQIMSFILATAGLVLAVLSWTDLCSFSGCTEAHDYRFFGISLQLLGTLYFCILITTMLLSNRFDSARLPLHLLLAGGAGAETVMIHLQKNVIQAWCPLCLGIAASVFILCIVKMIEETTASRGDKSMNKKQFISRLLLLTVAALAGFSVSFVGIKKPEAAGVDTALGKNSSKVEVYVFSDWLCPICIKVEPIIEDAYKTLDKRAKFYFIDKPVHKESMNFVPYHLSFLVNEKPKYIALRKALFELAKTNKNPSLADVQSVITPLGVTYKQLSFMDVSQTMARSQAISTEYKVSGTPTIVIVNSSSKKSKTLVGGKDITAENLLKAVKSLE